MCSLVWLAVWLLAAAGCVTVKVSLFEEPGPLKEKTISGYGRDKILLMEVTGVILEGPHRILGLGKGVTSPNRIKEELEKAAKDDRVKALVLKINSPGGTVSAADVILHELKAFKAAKGVPVVVCLQGWPLPGATTWPRRGTLSLPIPPALPVPSGLLP
jgi:protease-4